MSIVCLHFDYFLLIKRFRFLYKNITDCVSHNICPSRLLLKKMFHHSFFEQYNCLRLQYLLSYF